jgi:hypothetical protein
MIFITFRVFLSTERKKMVVAPDLMAKERRMFLTMVLDRGYVGESSLGYARLKTSKMRANKQNTLLSLHVTNQINSVHS